MDDSYSIHDLACLSKGWPPVNEVLGSELCDPTNAFCTEKIWTFIIQLGDAGPTGISLAPVSESKIPPNFKRVVKIASQAIFVRLCLFTTWTRSWYTYDLGREKWMPLSRTSTSRCWATGWTSSSSWSDRWPWTSSTRSTSTTGLSCRRSDPMTAG